MKNLKLKLAVFIGAIVVVAICALFAGHLGTIPDLADAYINNPIVSK